MTDPGPRDPRAGRFDDPTRDIRLPPPLGTPPPAMRPEWSSYAPPSGPAAPPAVPDPGPPPAHQAAGSARETPGPPTQSERLAGEPTDELLPPRGLPREPTLKFEHGAGVPVPAAPCPAARTREDGGRRWLWVLMALLPIVVIVGSGIWLFILLSHP